MIDANKCLHQKGVSMNTLSVQEQTGLRYLRCMMRYCRFHGAGHLAQITPEEAETYERIIAHAERDLGILPDEVNEREYRL